MSSEADPVKTPHDYLLAALEGALAVLSRYAATDPEADLAADRITGLIAGRNTCMWPAGCIQPAEVVASGRSYNGPPILCCARHAGPHADEDNPEYVVSCPNCGCMFGVN